MKSSFGKLRKLALHRHDAKEKREFQSPALLDELAQASEDMKVMRSCYDSLLSAAAATANSAYEFSESLRDMGSCILEKTALNDDERTGEVLLMLGKVQLELQKFLDSYRAHIVMTITNPSESLLKELRTVEEMKRQCDEKRDLYEYMKMHHKEKGRSRGGRGENFTSQQLQKVHDEFDDEATLCVFRLKSLKQGQSRSLLTQVARHHAAQLNFFRKGFKSLEALESHVRQIAEEQHIDYLFDGTDDEDDDDDDDDDIDDESVDADYGYADKRNEELSFNCRQQNQGPHSPSDFAELEPSDISFRRFSPKEHLKEGPKKQDIEILPSVDYRIGSHSAPIFPEKKLEPTEIRQPRPSISQKLNTHVLPTPPDAKESTPSRASTSAPRSRPTVSGRQSNKLWHSSPLEPSKHQKEWVSDDLSRPYASKRGKVFNEGSDNPDPFLRPPPLTELSHPYPGRLGRSVSKTYNRQASSITFNSRPVATKHRVSISGPISSTNYSHGVRLPIPRSSVSPKVSPTASPPHAIPRINELHELPRPPMGPASKTTISGSVGDIGHSAPLIYKSTALHVMHRDRDSSGTSSSASPLPLPPPSVTRSFSVPSSSGRAMALQAAKLLDHSNVQVNADGVASPPLTPISFACMMPVSPGYKVASPPSQIRGGS
uniref:Hydroxyproline-rich glycoprotein family protein n=1 Tax=Kalanchoe fedtschenkoi TaxID=63787 RepID=A0A7N0T837_KALFE